MKKFVDFKIVVRIATNIVEIPIFTLKRVYIIISRDREDLIFRIATEIKLKDMISRTITMCVVPSKN